MFVAATIGLGGCHQARCGDTSSGDVDIECVDNADGEKGGSLFEKRYPWDDEVSGITKSLDSDTIIGALASGGGWGEHGLRIDFEMNLLHANSSTPFERFSPTSDFFAPDCDLVPFPVPRGGALEGTDGYSCTTDDDCHLLVVDEPTKKLYEMWRADMSGGNFEGGCAAVWNLDESYSPNLRGEGCTSADASGLPVAPLLFSADEIAKGSIDHAIRFVLPMDRIRNGSYVHPATHSTDKTMGGPDAPPFGIRLRLRADFPIENLSSGARVIGRALQRYGMILADAGSITLTAQSDRFTTHKWSDVGVIDTSLVAIDVRDMEVVDMGEDIPYTGNCVREN
jgi:serine/threonine-protein kinase